MPQPKPFTAQLIIIGGFLVFFYIFFALATQIYKDYKLQKHIEDFQSGIDELAQLAQQKPEDVAYFSSPEYKDRYAKENLNLLDPGEKLIVIPQGEQNIVKGSSRTLAAKTTRDILLLSKPTQWWEYFFGQTLSLGNPSPEPIPQVPSPLQEPTKS